MADAVLGDERERGTDTAVHLDCDRALKPHFVAAERAPQFAIERDRIERPRQIADPAADAARRDLGPRGRGAN